MHDVYRNTLLTLVATSASNAYDSFLSCEQSKSEKAVVPYISPSTQKVSGSFHLLAKTIHRMDQYFDRHVEATYWNSRGWTFQERLLSRRLVHFSKSMLVFECRSSTYCEDNTPSTGHNDRTPWLETHGGGPHIHSLSLLPIERRLVYIWYLLVERYSRRRLSYGMDKLPALSGLAHELDKMEPDEYLAGIWKRDLHWGLLWDTVAYEDIHESNTYRAPSWSWA